MKEGRQAYKIEEEMRKKDEGTIMRKEDGMFEWERKDKRVK